MEEKSPLQANVTREIFYWIDRAIYTQDDWPFLMLKWIFIKLAFIPISSALVLEDITPDQEKAKKPR